MIKWSFLTHLFWKNHHAIRSVILTVLLVRVFFGLFRMLLFSLGRAIFALFFFSAEFYLVVFLNINHPPTRREGGWVSPSSALRIPHHRRCVGRPEPMAPRARCGGTTLVPNSHFNLCSPSTQAIGHAGPRDLSVRPPNPRGVK